VFVRCALLITVTATCIFGDNLRFYISNSSVRSTGLKSIPDVHTFLKHLHNIAFTPMLKLAILHA